MELYLVRHGESNQNIGKGEGITDSEIELSTNGIKQAEEVGIKLKEYFNRYNISLENSRMWASSYLRATQTAELINEMLQVKELFEDPRLVEMDFGIFDGVDEEKWEEIDKKAWDEIQKRKNSVRGKFFHRMPLGESPADVYNRVTTFIDTLHRDRNDPVIIVSHGITIRCFVMRFLHKNLEWFYNEKNPSNCSVTKIFLNDSKYCYKKIL